jgi:hypothetical protein
VAGTSTALFVLGIARCMLDLGKLGKLLLEDTTGAV